MTIKGITIQGKYADQPRDQQAIGFTPVMTY